VLGFADLQAGRTGRDEEGAEAGLGDRVDVVGRDREQHVQVSDADVADQHLAAVDHPLVPVEDGAGGVLLVVRPAGRLGRAAGEDDVTARGRNQILQLLLLGAQHRDHAAGELGVSAHGHAQHGAGLGDLLHHDGQGGPVGAHAAELLLDRDAEEAELTGPLEQLHREAVLAIDLQGDRPHLPFDEIPCRVANQRPLVIEVPHAVPFVVVVVVGPGRCAR
jgi:hypothetical protein